MKLKRIAALAVSAVMMLSLGTAAMATDVNDGRTENFVDEAQLSIPKNYKMENQGTSNPAETFYFTIKPVAVTESDATDVPAFPDGGSFSISYAAGEATMDGLRKTVEANLPAFSKVGVYTYEITETPGNTAGVTYSGQKVYLKVTVVEENGLKRVVAMHYESEAGEKLDNSQTLGFDNVYKAARQIGVSKTVTGNMGDKDKYFDVTVTVNNPDGKTAPETYAVQYVPRAGTQGAENSESITAGSAAVFRLKDGDVINIQNVPYGVTYTVEEADYTGAGYDKAKYSGNDGQVDSAEESVTITNNKGVQVDTGITLDSVPYILVLCLVVLCTVVLFVRKRFSVNR